MYKKCAVCSVQTQTPTTQNHKLHCFTCKLPGCLARLQGISSSLHFANRTTIFVCTNFPSSDTFQQIRTSLHLRTYRPFPVHWPILPPSLAYSSGHTGTAWYMTCRLWVNGPNMHSGSRFTETEKCMQVGYKRSTSAHTSGFQNQQTQ